MTQRLARSSRTPALKFPSLKSATPDMAKSVTVSAISAGCEKKRASPPEPRIASPRKARVATMLNSANLGEGVMAR